jgi:putative FmdB family regulatory protein
MPTYRYECANPACVCGGAFELRQSIHDDAPAACPHCGGPVARIVQPTRVAVPRSDTDLRDMGFAKLVKRDKGVYENVTAMSHESRYFEAGKRETMPDLSKRVTD